MFEVGRLAVKIAGRDAGKKCVVVEIIDDNNVLIDGETRRRKCNVEHLELLDKVLKIKKGASHDDIAKEFEKLGLKARVTKPKGKTERPRKVRKQKEKPVKEKKEAKKTEKKGAEKKEVEKKEIKRSENKEVKEEKKKVDRESTRRKQSFQSKIS